MSMTLNPPSAAAPAAAPAQARLSRPTEQLLFIAAQSQVLRRLMGMELPDRSNGHVVSLRFLKGVPRPWLQTHPLRREELTFNPDLFYTVLTRCSDGEAYMVLWILNVWNPAYARVNGWTFDLFRAIQTLDAQEAAAIADWLNDGALMP